MFFAVRSTAPAQLALDVGRELLLSADDAKPDVVLEQRVQLEAQIPLEQRHQRRDFRLRPLPVLEREGVQRQDVDAEPSRRFNRFADRSDAGPMAFDARQVAARGPAAVAVHDDRDVGRELLEVDLAGQRLVGRAGGKPRQQLVKRHRDLVQRANRNSSSSAPRRARGRTGGAVMPAAARKRPSSTPGMLSGGRRLSPTSTRVPAIARTMCRRNPLAETSKTTSVAPSGIASGGWCSDCRFRGPRQDRRRGDGADRMRHMAACGLERAEIVRATECGGGCRHRRHVQGAGNVPDVLAEEGAGGLRLQNQVAIGLAPRREPGVKIGRHLFDRGDPHDRWKLRVDRPSQRRPVMRVEDAGAGHLRQRVNPGVGAAGTMHLSTSAPSICDSADFQQPLHRSAARLPLPPDELGPIVGDS